MSDIQLLLGKMSTGFRHDVILRHPNGLVVRAHAVNLVPLPSCDDLLSIIYTSSGYTSAHYIGLLPASPTLNSSDTMASKVWTELAAYGTPTVRPTLTIGTPSGGFVDNSAATVSFTMNATGTMGGLFVATSSTIGETASMLRSEAAFTGGDEGYVSGTVATVTTSISMVSA